MKSNIYTTYFVLDVCLEASRSQYLEIFYSLPLHENHSCELSERTFRPFLTMPLIVTTKTSLYTKYNFAAVEVCFNYFVLVTVSKSSCLYKQHFLQVIHKTECWPYHQSCER